MASPFWLSLKTARPGWYKEGKIRFLFQYGSDPHPELKDVPLALDLLKSQADKTLLSSAGAPLGLGRPFGAPPGIPADRLTALRSAMMATFKDPAFLADCEQQRLECKQRQNRRRARCSHQPRLRNACRNPQAADRHLSGGRQRAVATRSGGVRAEIG